MPLVPLDALAWDDLFTRSLPGDASRRTTSRQLPGAFYAEISPTPVAGPRLLAWSREAGELLGAAPPTTPAEADAVAAVLGGNRVLAGMRPYAAGYGGHQFGNWAGQLGDGRALTLGEVRAPDGRRWDVQLKGAGPTPYSRRSDGRAVLRSSIREFLCSEAMHHLGVPTTRALSLVATGDRVVRDMFYDGHPRAEPGAIVCRLAPTFLRFGNFEVLTWREDVAGLRRLVRYTLAEHFPEFGAELGAAPGREPSDEPIEPGLVARWFAEVARRTAVMVAHWMRVGFVHGVMNTDNMSILGLTIDYGPYGWLDPFDPDFTPNTTDAGTGRYRFGMQPGVAQWNLAQLARALAPLCPGDADKEALVAGLETYRQTFERTYGELMRGKLGLTAPAGGDGGADELLINDLLAVLLEAETDMTLFFRGLAQVTPRSAAGALTVTEDELVAPLSSAMYAPMSDAHRDKLAAWLRRYLPRAAREPGAAEGREAARQARMAAHNPVFVLRNYLAQEAINLAEKSLEETSEIDPSGILRLLDAARSPYREGPEHEGLLGKRPDWARQAPGCSALSCSS
jgi:serine/tyrosine/threonine adenylyltransferase